MSATFLNQLLAPLVFLLFSASFLAVWHFNRNWHSALLFFISYLCCAVAFGLEALPHDPGLSEANRFAGDLFYTFSSVFFLLGIQARFRLPYTFVTIGLLFSAITLAHGWFRFFDPDIVARVRVITTGSAILLSIAAVQTLTNGKSFVDRVLCAFLGFFAIALVLSTFITESANAEVTPENFSRSLLLALINLLVTTSALAVALTLLLDFILTAYLRVRLQSETDELTGLLNRRGFETRVQARLQQGHDAALIMADIDHFKVINDTQGHLAGDSALKKFADVISTTARQDDLVGRIGGEEFCILLPGASLRGAKGLAERMRERLQEISREKDDEFGSSGLTASFGVAAVETDDDYVALFNRADKALYAAKEKGRDRVEMAGQTLPLQAKSLTSAAST